MAPFERNPKRVRDGVYEGAGRILGEMFWIETSER